MKGKFSSDLGARTVQCNPQDVTGTQRYRFFASARSSRSESLNLLQNHSNCQLSNSENVNNRFGDTKQRSFESCGIQTEDVKAIYPSEEDENDTKLFESKPLTSLQFEKMTREKERREQEAALPPVTDKQSLEAYRIFLEENEKKDFKLREKELDDKLNQKLKRIERSLYERYEKIEAINDEKIQLIQKSKLATLKKKVSSRKPDKISDISNLHEQQVSTLSYNDLDVQKLHSNKKYHKYSTKHKITQKVQEDLDLIMLSFQNVNKFK